MHQKDQAAFIFTLWAMQLSWTFSHPVYTISSDMRPNWEGFQRTGRISKRCLYRKQRPRWQGVSMAGQQVGAAGGIAKCSTEFLWSGAWRDTCELPLSHPWGRGGFQTELKIAKMQLVWGRPAGRTGRDRLQQKNNPATSLWDDQVSLVTCLINLPI